MVAWQERGLRREFLSPSGDMKLFALRLFLVLAVVLASRSVPVEGQEGDRPKTPEESHARMLAALETVRAETDDTNFYIGEAQARQLRKIVGGFDAGTPASDRFDGHMRLGLAELNLGNEREAIAQLHAAREVFPESGLPDASLSECLYFTAVSWLRIAETRNCCQKPSMDSCLFPLRGGGIHTDTEGSENSIRVLEELLDRESLTAKIQADAAWLLNLAHMTLDSWPEGVDPRWRIALPDGGKGSAAGEPFPEFRNVAADRGLGTYGLAGGVAADDFTGDGRIDLVVSCWDSRVPLRFFLQLPDGTFEDRSESANFAGLYGGLNLVHADYDNDGDLDLLVLRGAYLGEHGQHPNSLLRNEGPGPDGVPRFIDVTFLSGIGDLSAPTQTAEFADFDLDGDLDLFIGNETSRRLRVPCQLFRNEGDGRFTDITATAGVENFGYTKGCSWGDFDGDGDPDLYVANLDGANRLYKNYGGGTFIDVAPGLGVDGPERTFPTWFWDFNNDGHLDLFASNYTTGGRVYWPYYRGETLDDGDIAALYLGDGEGGFRNAVRELGLDAPMVPMGSNFGDLNNDGFPEIYLGTGTPNYADVVPNLLFVNQRGEGFEDRTVAARMGHLQKGHGVAFADFDNDGDLDVFEQMGGAVPGDPYYDALFENPGFAGTHWLQVRLKGVRSNRFGIGARLRAVIEEDGVERSVYTTVNGGGSFGSNPTIQHLGLGTAAEVKRLEIFWPVSGETQVLSPAPVDQRIEITEGEPGWKTF